MSPSPPLTWHNSSVFLCLSSSWYFWGVLLSYFALFLNLGLSDAFSWLYWGCTFWARKAKMRYTLLRASCEGYLVLTCVATGDANLAHLAKRVSTRLLTIPHSVVNGYLGRDTLRPCWPPASLQILTHRFQHPLVDPAGIIAILIF